MVFTFPHMGNTYIAAKALFDSLHIPYVIPEPNNKTTLQRGSALSPEEMCLPYKIMLGNYLDGIEKGADTILIAGSCGPCRFGEYCELHMKTLRKMGFEGLEFIVIDPPSSIGLPEFKRRIERIGNASKLTGSQKMRALLPVLKVLSLMERLEADAHYLAGYEANKGDCKNLLAYCKKEAINCKNTDETLKLLKKCRNTLAHIEIDKGKNPLKISIIGEIYTIIDPFSNLFIEEKLMDYGVSTVRTLSPAWWLKDAILKPAGLNSIKIRRAARRYLPYNVGGHGRECVGEAALSIRDGFDGAIQIFPLGCMPEVVAKSVLQTMQKESGLPILTLIVDEMTGEVGYLTRIEAFLDMLRIKKNKG